MRTKHYFSRNFLYLINQPTMSDEIYSEPEQALPTQRSTFLTVLCVLTFLGSAFGIFQGITAFVSADKMVTEMNKNITEQEKATKEIEQKKNDPGSKFALKMIDSVKGLTAEKLKQSSIASSLANVLTLLGALLMWRLNRKGFYLYVAGIIATVAAPFIIFGSGNIMAIFGSAIPAFFGVIFIAMYAFNLKDMK
jgi:hypothetical protein